MKKIFLLLSFVSLSIISNAQAPNAIPYQGVARNAAGNILDTQNIYLRVSIHDITANGTIVFRETFSVTTNTLGLFSINIGTGTPITGTLASVNWGNGAKFLQVEMDATDGTNYTDMGTTQFMSVPYALFAGSSANLVNSSYVDLTTNQTGIAGKKNWADTATFNVDATINDVRIGRGGGGVFYNTAIGQEALQTNTVGSFNTANGYKSLFSNSTGSFNTANGHEALYSNTSGINNTANGYLSLYSNTTGDYNTAIGLQSLQSNTIGFGNTANGSWSLLHNTQGFYNTANGGSSLYSNTTGNYNTASGFQSLSNNITGSFNTASGFQSLSANTTGASNTAAGFSSLNSNLTGNNNTALGFTSLSSNVTGSNNTALGYSADVNSGGYSNATAIGAYAIVTASNTIQLGDGNVTSVNSSGSYSGKNFNSSGSITSSGGGIGYTTGAGGTITQATSRSTAVTLNKLCGNITLVSAAQASQAVVSFTLNNSFIAPTDFILVEHISSTNAGAWQVSVVPAAGNCIISLRNVSNASITEATPLRFAIIKATTN